MDKLAIVIGNYADRECDADTTPRQAYERGFRRATEKYETVMCSRKAKNAKLESENAKLRNLMQKSIDEQFEACDSWDNHCDMCDCSCFVSENRDELRALGFEVDG